MHAIPSSGYSCETTEHRDHGEPKEGLRTANGEGADTQSLEASGACWSRGTPAGGGAGGAFPACHAWARRRGSTGSGPATGVPQRVHSYRA